MAPISKEDLDWFRSPEATQQGVHPDEVKVMEDLWARKETLLANIESAFVDVQLGNGIGLLEADALDMCVDPSKPREAKKKDRRTSWRSLSESDLEWCNTALSFTDAAGYRFLLPAFMVAELSSEIDVLTLIHLSIARDDKYGKRTLLNAAQLETVIEFLELYLDDPYSEFHHKDILEALDVYWKPLLKKNSHQADDT